MSDAVLLFLVLVIVTVGSLFLLLYSRKKQSISNRTPAALANQVLRYPERILIDVPLYTATQELHPYEFLLKTEAELASIGELESRRQFLVRYAEVINAPSKDSIRNLTNFLLRDAPDLFRETLRWDGKCNKAFQFLEFIDHLIESIEKGKEIQITHSKNKKRKKAARKSTSGNLHGLDEKISQEWNELNQALHTAVASLSQKRGEILSNPTGDLHIGSIRLLADDRVPHLIPLLQAARDVCKSVVLIKAH